MRRGQFLVAAAVAAAACSSEPSGPAAGDSLTVMTYNLYLGADLIPIIQAPAPESIPTRAAVAWGVVQATNFPLRAGRIAALIEADRPDIIGLQEVPLYRRQSPSDAVVGGTTPATAVVYDFLQLVRDSLAARGLSYTLVAADTSSDVEIPVFVALVGGQPTFDDIRYTDRDAILVRSDLSTSAPARGVFTARLTLAVAGLIPLTIKRGWTAVTVSAGGRQVRFVNTHLEAESDSVQQLQAAELLSLLQGQTGPLIVVGDLNSPADSSGSLTYPMMIGAGFADAWVAGPGGDAGYTCCQNETLSNAASALIKRIDFVLVKGGVTATSATVVGRSTADRTSSGLWPSDHAGVAATLRLP